MFEIEKKFVLTPEAEKELLENAEFLSEKTFEDIYYDTEDYFLTKADKWLRCREGKFEMKIPLPGNNKVRGNQYEELVTKQEIKNQLNIMESGDLSEILEKRRIKPFCKFKTFRRKYRKDNYIIDIDIADYGDFLQSLVEIESLIEDKKKADETMENIIAFGKRSGLLDGRVRGKVIQYLKNKKPRHYDALVTCGVVEDF